jgi:hypothetical protein
MRIPSKVRIGAQAFDVVFTDNCDDAQNLGVTKAHLNRMEIARKADGERIPEGSLTDTFMHEIIHAISITYGLGLKERQVAGLAGGMLAVIRNNGLDFRK